MRVKVFFGSHSLEAARDAIKPADALLVNEARGFLSAELTPEQVADVRARGFTVKEDTQYDIDPVL